MFPFVFAFYLSVFFAIYKFWPVYLGQHAVDRYYRLKYMMIIGTVIIYAI